MKVLCHPNHLSYQQIMDSKVYLDHPVDGECCFILADCLYQLREFHQPDRSWIVDGSIVQNGSLFLLTRYDPLFIALKIIQKEQLFIQKDELLPPELCPYVDLSKICLVKHVSGLEFFKLCPEKTMDWLTAKVTRMSDLPVREVLDELNTNLTPDWRDKLMHHYKLICLT
jgi:hypothetical protein